jgi:O-antigen ligase
MVNQSAALIARVTAYSSFLVTVLVVTAGINEPVNAPKMLALATFGFTVLGLFLIPFVNETFNKTKIMAFRITSVVAVLFIAQILIANILSSQPFEHGFYGTYGRSTGSLTYISLCFFMVACIIISNNDLTEKLTTSLFYAGLFNLAYFTLTLFGLEIFNWNNPSKSVLGTFGNSNFAGAFMGIFLVSCIVRMIKMSRTPLNLITHTIIVALTVFEIIKSKATQGVIVSAIGILVLFFFWIRSRYSQKFLSLYVFLVSALGLFVLGGIFQVGPLTRFLYKVSVSLRGGYWDAGLQMGLGNPFFGVGPDSYGFYYRFFRGQKIMDLAGPTTTTDAAHNVFIDIFAYGGFPLLALYLLLQLIAVVVIFREVKSSKNFDPIFAGLTACWIAYHAQSFVSINQIGVAIWGWIFTGLIIGRANRIGNLKEPTSKPLIIRKIKPQITNEKSSSLRDIFLSVVLGTIGFGLAVQPIVSDATYVSALKKKEIGGIEIAAKKWPTNPVRLGDAATIFSNNGFQNQSLSLAKFSIEKYPDSYVSWFVYYSTPKLSDLEKAKALQVLQKLDPLNPDLKK